MGGWPGPAGEDPKGGRFRSLGRGRDRGKPGCRGRDEFKFGLTPVFLTNDLELLARLRDYLQRRTSHSVRLVTKRTYQEITSLLISGQLDAAWICGFPFVAYRPQLALVAVPLWQGKPLYRSYLINRSRPAGREPPRAEGRRARFLRPGQQFGVARHCDCACEGRADSGSVFRADD